MDSAHGLRLCQVFRRQDVVAVIRGELEKIRWQILTGAEQAPDPWSPDFFEAVRQELLQRTRPSLVGVINATGIILHTNLGRAPLASEAFAAIKAAAQGYCNLEIDLEEGGRGSRYSHVEEILCRLTGAEAAIVVNNCAAAVLLSLTALAKGSEVVVSRGELIEIGGSFRMPDVIAQSGARMVEVGTTNKTRITDYENAINEHTRVILKSHSSNYRIIGFCAAAQRNELAGLANEKGLTFMEDLGSGTLVDLRRYGLPHEPTVQECLRAGAHVLTFSGDKLLGGPQAGLIVGRQKEIAELKKHALLRAMRIDKLSLAALEATLRLYELPTPPEQHIPVLRMLAANKAAIGRRTRRLAKALRTMPEVTCRIEDDVSLAGGGSLPEAELPTQVLAIRVSGYSASRLSTKLRCGNPALVGRIVDDSFVIDLRTVTPAEAREIPALIHAAIV